MTGAFQDDAFQDPTFQLEPAAALLERTPRIAWDNLAASSTTTLTASAQQGSLPARWLRDQLRSLVWRTPIGWTVVAGFNDVVPFVLNAVTYGVTVAAALYVTGAEMAAALQVAMRSPGGSCSTITVSYSGASKKFTFAHGSLQLRLKWASGTNAWKACGADSGFSADTGDALSHTSTTVAYQGRAYIDLDLGSARAAQLAIVGDHNLTEDGTATLLGNATAAWSAPTTTEDLEGDDPLRLAFFTEISKRYFRIVLSDVTNPEGFYEIGLLFLGPYIQPDRAFLQGYRHASLPISSAQRADQGAVYGQVRTDPYVFSGKLSRISRATRDAFRLMEATVGLHRCWWLFEDPLNYPVAETHYGLLTAKLAYEQTIGDGDPPDRYSIDIPFAEALG